MCLHLLELQSLINQSGHNITFTIKYIKIKPLLHYSGVLTLNALIFYKDIEDRFV